MGEKLAPIPRGPVALKLAQPEALFDRMAQIHETIARRAFQIFEEEGRLFGRDLDHWFRAEAELFPPIPLKIAEFEDTITLEAELPGFGADELKVSVEPRRVIICGEKRPTKQRSEGSKVHEEQYSERILRIVELPVAVDFSKSVATLRDGRLEVKMPKTREAEARPLEIAAA